MVQSPLFWITLGLAVPLYWTVPAAARPWILVAASAVVLATLAPAMGLFLVVFTVAFVAMERRVTGPARRLGFGVALGGLAAGLVGFKLAAAVPTADLAVPLGLSFVTFRLLHYGIEASRGGLPPHRTADVLAWILFFPVYTAGPIARFDTWENRAERAPSQGMVVEGLTRIAHGLVKRFVFAEVIEATLMRGESAAVLLDRLDTLTPLQVWLWVIASFLRLWFDFAGYTDIALGAARLFGLRLEENFDWPVLARSPTDFWRRWHASLSRWCQSYVYLPLLGLTRSPTLATFGTFLTMGFWHAASPQWLLWGLYHGAGVALTGLGAREWRRRKRGPPPPALGYVGIPFTFLFAASAHAFTAVHGVGTGWDAVRVYGHLFGLAL